jgi:hypothetical protein
LAPTNFTNYSSGPFETGRARSAILGFGTVAIGF